MAAADQVKQKLAAFQAAASTTIAQPKSANDIGEILEALDQAAGRMRGRLGQPGYQHARSSNPTARGHSTAPTVQSADLSHTSPHTSAAADLLQALTRFVDAAQKQPAAYGMHIGDVLQNMDRTVGEVRNALPQMDQSGEEFFPEPEPVQPGYARKLRQQANRAGSGPAASAQLPESSSRVLSRVTNTERPNAGEFTVIGPEQDASYEPLSAAAAKSLLARFGTQNAPSETAQEPVVPSAAAQALRAVNTAPAAIASTGRQQRPGSPGLMSRLPHHERTGTNEQLRG